MLMRSATGQARRILRLCSLKPVRRGLGNTQPSSLFLPVQLRVFPRTYSRSRRVSRDVATASGLRLGLTEKEIEDILGKPTERHSSSLVYTSLGHRKMTDEERRNFQQTFPQSGAFDMLVMTLIKLKLMDGHVTWFQVAYTVTT